MRRCVDLGLGFWSMVMKMIMMMMMKVMREKEEVFIEEKRKDEGFRRWLQRR